MFPIRSRSDTPRLVSLEHDLSYCCFLNHKIRRDALVQGALELYLTQILSLIDKSSAGESLKIGATPSTSLFLNFFLVTNPSVRFITFTEYGLEIKIAYEKPKQSRIESHCSLFLKNNKVCKISPLLQGSENGFDVDTQYLYKINEVVNAIFQALKNQKSVIEIESFGYDRSFFKLVLKQLFPNTIRLVFPKYGRPGYLKIVFSEQKLKSSEPLEENYRVLNSLKELTISKKNQAPEPHLAQRGFHWPAMRTIKSEHYEYCCSLLHNYFAYCYSVSEKSAIDELGDDDFYTWFRELRTNTHFIESLKIELRESLIEFPSADERWLPLFLEANSISEIIQAYHSNMALCREPIKKAWGGILLLEELSKPSLPLHLISLTKAKLRAETREYKFDVQTATLNSVILSDLSCSYWSYNASVPLLEISINEKRVLPSCKILNSNSAQSIAYFTDVFTELSKYIPRVGRDLDIKKLAHIIVSDQKKLDDLSFSEQQLLLLLQMGSFSAYNLGDTLLRSEILAKLAPTYSLNHLVRQIGLSCEFNLSDLDHFSVTRNGEYTLIKDGESRGSITFKQRLELCEGKICLKVHCPRILLSHGIPFEEQESIYQRLAGKELLY